MRPKQRKELWHSGAVALLGSTLLFVTGLWLSNSGIQNLQQNAWDSLGRLFGLWAANLLLWQILTFSRIPLLERGLGRNGLAKMHRWMGFTSFFLIILHIVLITIGYAQDGKISWWRQFYSFVATYPGMLLAFAGTVLLFMVVGLSIRAARRRLRYESWHLIHLYSYLGSAFVLPHQLWTGNDFLSSPIATTYWWAAWIACAALAIFYRLLFPLIWNLLYPMKVGAVRDEGNGHVLVEIVGPAHRWRSEAGQVHSLRFLERGGWTRANPFSLAAHPHPFKFTYSIKMVGEGTRALLDLRPGQRVLMERPYGSWRGSELPPSKILLAGAGSGIAPLIALAESSPSLSQVVLLDRLRSAEFQVRPAAISELKERGIHYLSLMGERSQSNPSWLPSPMTPQEGSALLQELTKGRANEWEVYMCGPLVWTKSLRISLIGAGFLPSRIQEESFAY